MFFRKQKERKKISPRTIKLLLFILLVNIIYIMFFGDAGDSPGIMLCDKGALESIQSCKEASSQPGSKGVWWFSDAYGALDKNVCTQMSLEQEVLTFAIPRRNTTDTLLKSPCSTIGLTDNNFCYTSQQLSADGLVREVRILTTNSHCGEARYFRGQNATLFKHVITPNLNPSEIIKDMPEIKK